MQVNNHVSYLITQAGAGPSKFYIKDTWLQVQRLLNPAGVAVPDEPPTDRPFRTVRLGETITIEEMEDA